jgi:hypothetical protein
LATVHEEGGAEDVGALVVVDVTRVVGFCVWEGAGLGLGFAPPPLQEKTAGPGTV